MSGPPELRDVRRVLSAETEGLGREREALDDALGRCYALLARREHSTAELRGRLERAGVDEATIDAAIAIVAEQGYLDDERYARLLAEDRRSIDGWGAERIRVRLERAGIARELIDATLAPFTAASELDAACALLDARLRAVPSTNPERQRAYALLVRQGFDSDLAYDAVRRHEAQAETE
jgi:regulatory protein